MGLFNRAKKPAAKADEKKEEKKVVQAETKAEKAEKAPRETGDSYRTLLRPIVTEKSTAAGKEAAYVFEVAPSANKIAVKKAIKDLYGVEAVSVRVLRVLGKPVRTRSGFARRAAWRKAYVTLKKGQTIDVYAA